MQWLQRVYISPAVIHTSSFDKLIWQNEQKKFKFAKSCKNNLLPSLDIVLSSPTAPVLRPKRLATSLPTRWFLFILLRNCTYAPPLTV